MKQNNPIIKNITNTQVTRLINIIAVFLLIQPCSALAFNKNTQNANRKLTFWKDTDKSVQYQYHGEKKDAKEIAVNNVNNTFFLNYNMGKTSIRLGLPLWLENVYRNKGQYGLSLSYRF